VLTTRRGEKNPGRRERKLIKWGGGPKHIDGGGTLDHNPAVKER